MATKEDVTTYIDTEWDTSSEEWNQQAEDYWTGSSPDLPYASRLSMVQCWMSPEIAKILQKLVGDANMVTRIAKNVSNDLKGNN